MSDRQADQTPDPWVNALRTALDAVEQTIQQQAAQIEALKRAVSPPPASGDVEHQQTIQQQAAQIETLTQALEKIAATHIVFPDKDPAFGSFAVVVAREALAGGTRPTEGEQGALQ